MRLSSEKGKIKIKNIDDISNVAEKIIGHLVEGKLSYFNIIFCEETELSHCFMTPVSQLSRKKSMIMVEDYEKFLKILLSNSHISDLEYMEKENVVTAVFSSPYPKKER